jgi:hypothetical protein
MSAPKYYDEIRREDRLFYRWAPFLAGRNCGDVVKDEIDGATENSDHRLNELDIPVTVGNEH